MAKFHLATLAIGPDTLQLPFQCHQLILWVTPVPLLLPQVEMAAWAQDTLWMLLVTAALFSRHKIKYLLWGKKKFLEANYCVNLEDFRCLNRLWHEATYTGGDVLSSCELPRFNLLGLQWKLILNGNLESYFLSLALCLCRKIFFFPKLFISLFVVVYNTCLLVQHIYQQRPLLGNEIIMASFLSWQGATSAARARSAQTSFTPPLIWIFCVSADLPALHGVPDGAL